MQPLTDKPPSAAGSPERAGSDAGAVAVDPTVRSEAERILNRAARRLLTEQLAQDTDGTAKSNCYATKRQVDRKPSQHPLTYVPDANLITVDSMPYPSLASVHKPAPRLAMSSQE